ncbi:PspA/IM30 family protein [Corynebacterium mayonis]|uniref:PspA/IM30 family protein n=1 Tax=Corynebacterium mayonis TaxID=3062461 RepID=UPI0031408890
MPNPFNKGWKYLMQSLDAKIEENADPKVQVQQAIAEAKRRHNEITHHAAHIIGNRNQLQMKLERLLKSQEDLQGKARAALQAADKATVEGDTHKAGEFNQTAEMFASQLVSVEQEIEQTKGAFHAAEQAAAEAQQKQKQSEARLQEQLGQVAELESQIEQAQMQEQTAATMDSINQFGGNDNVPTLDAVRQKIERRHATALGAQELAQSSLTPRISEIESGSNDFAASARLAEIRASMDNAGELEAGKSAAENAHDTVSVDADDEAPNNLEEDNLEEDN